MTHTNKLTLHFYMNGKDGGEIEVSLAYGSCRYYGGRTTICNSRKFLDQFNPDGTLKRQDLCLIAWKLSVNPYWTA